MKSLYEKIIQIYPELTPQDFSLFGTIELRNDSNGLGDYISSWTHANLAQPTQEQLDAIQ